MSILITTKDEGTSPPITVSFTDGDGAATVPTSIAWSLANQAGTVLDSGTETPSTSVTIILDGTLMPWASAKSSETTPYYLKVTAGYTDGSVEAAEGRVEIRDTKNP